MTPPPNEQATIVGTLLYGRGGDIWKVEGTSSLELKSSGQVKVEGSTVSISGSGMVEVKGSMIKLG